MERTRLFQRNSLDTAFGGREANAAASLGSFGIYVNFALNTIGDARLRTLKSYGVENVYRHSGRMGLCISQSDIIFADEADIQMSLGVKAEGGNKHKALCDSLMYAYPNLKATAITLMHENLPRFL